MTVGYTYIYACPSCSSLVSQRSMGSGNTIDAVFYTDGKCEAPMLPEFPAITKCPSCDTIFWLNRSECVDKYNPFYDSRDDLKDILPARFLTPDGYNTAFEENREASEKNLLFLSKRIWWGFNDRVRKGGELFNAEEEEALWDKNRLRLLYLLKEEDESQRLLKAELFRNHGDFDRCLELLSTINDPDLLRHKEVCEAACKEQNTLVQQLPKRVFNFTSRRALGR